MMRNGFGRLRGTHKLRILTTNPSSRRWVRFQARCSPDFSDYAILGLNPFASKADVKHAYKSLALKYHPDVIKGENSPGKHDIFKDIKSAYESLMRKFEEEESRAMEDYDEYDEWDEWMGFEGGIPGIPAIYNP